MRGGFMLCEQQDEIPLYESTACKMTTKVPPGAQSDRKLLIVMDTSTYSSINAGCELLPHRGG
jgi:hypothetical protein